MKNINETNRIKELFQDEGFKNTVLSTIALGYGASHPDVIAGYNMVRSISTITGKEPMSVVFDLSNENETRFVSVVEKKDHSTYGALFSMHEDLGNYIDNIDTGKNELHRMAYAYARRYAAAGLFAQGIVDNDEYAQTLKVFKAMQQTTGHTKEFQIEANEQAIEYVLSYSSELTLDLISFFVESVENGGMPCFKDEDKWWDFDQLIEMFTGFMASETTHEN